MIKVLAQNRIALNFLHRFLQSRILYVYLVCEIAAALILSLIAHQPVLLYVLDAVLFFPVFVYHIAGWQIKRLVQVASFWGIMKSLAFISAALLMGDAITPLVDQGPAYHIDTLNWIQTGKYPPPDELIHIEIGCTSAGSDKFKGKRMSSGLVEYLLEGLSVHVPFRQKLTAGFPVEAFESQIVIAILV